MKTSKTVSRAFLLILVAATLGLTACETMEGMGRDISKAGNAIEDAAK